MNHENEDDENMEETKQHLGNHASVGEGARALKVRGPRRRGALNFPEEWQGKEGFVVNRKRKASEYRGVSKEPSNKSNPWKARINIEGKMKHIGRYPSEVQAARAFDAVAVQYGRQLNFPAEWKSKDFPNQREQRASAYRGVYKNPKNKLNPWYALININGKLKYVGCYAIEEEAARAYDAAAARAFGIRHAAQEQRTRQR